MSPPFLMIFAPGLFAFEFAQLFVAERYLGVKQLDRGIDPRTASMAEPLAFGWSVGIIALWLWMFAMLGLRFGSGQIPCMLVVSLLGYGIRRSCRLKWVLMTLTFEAAIRIGMMVSLMALAWRTL